MEPDWLNDDGEQLDALMALRAGYDVRPRLLAAVTGTEEADTAFRAALMAATPGDDAAIDRLEWAWTGWRLWYGQAAHAKVSDQRRNARANARKGGRRRNLWAQAVSSQLRREAEPGLTRDQLIALLPRAPMEMTVRIRGQGFSRVQVWHAYVDGDRLCAVSGEGEEQAIALSTFKQHHL